MPNGPYLLCFDGSEAAARAIHAAAGLVGSGHPSAVIYVYKPTERSLGVAQALTGGSIDAPVSGETDAHAVLDAGMAVARDAGFAPSPLLVAADRRVAEIITAKAEELDAPAIVMG